MKSSGLCYAGQPRLMVPLLPLIDDSFKEVLEVLGGKVLELSSVKGLEVKANFYLY